MNKLQKDEKKKFLKKVNVNKFKLKKHKKRTFKEKQIVDLLA